MIYYVNLCLYLERLLNVSYWSFGTHLDILAINSQTEERYYTCDNRIFANFFIEPVLFSDLIR